MVVALPQKTQDGRQCRRTGGVCRFPRQRRRGWAVSSRPGRGWTSITPDRRCSRRRNRCSPRQLRNRRCPDRYNVRDALTQRHRGQQKAEAIQACSANSSLVSQCRLAQPHACPERGHRQEVQPEARRNGQRQKPHRPPRRAPGTPAWARRSRIVRYSYPLSSGSPVTSHSPCRRRNDPK